MCRYCRISATAWVAQKIERHHDCHGADVAAVSPVPAQMWQGRAQCHADVAGASPVPGRCGSGEPSLDADVARVRRGRTRHGVSIVALVTEQALVRSARPVHSRSATRASQHDSTSLPWEKSSMASLAWQEAACRMLSRKVSLIGITHERRIRSPIGIALKPYKKNERWRGAMRLHAMHCWALRCTREVRP